MYFYFISTFERFEVYTTSKVVIFILFLLCGAGNTCAHGCTQVLVDVFLY